MENLLHKLKTEVIDAPLKPGCYIMRGDNGKIIYVGKAKVLKHRLLSYFNGKKDIKTATLMRHVQSIETIIVSNEYEALLLENTLIKQHTPKYNIDLKDGKSYPVIRITNEDFPKIIKTRTIIKDNSLYFGPFTNVYSIDKFLDVLKKLYPIRKCKTLYKRNNPCIYYHIDQCKGPCCGKISPEEYAKPLKKIIQFLNGETTPLAISLSKKMHGSARNLLFEKAAQYRDAIKAIEELSKSNSVVDFDFSARDYIAFATEGILTTWIVFSVRGGKLSGREIYRTKSAATESDALETFMTIFYSDLRMPPQYIFIQETEGNFDKNNIKQYFQNKFKFIPSIEIPNEKRHLSALALAKQNAIEDLRKRLKERNFGPILDELKKILSLKRRPEHIEGFDIAQLDGKHPVASLISFHNGSPDKKNYRIFKLKTVIGKVDDFASIREAVKRRYTNLLQEQKQIPDLILIDGGIGQVNAAKKALSDLGIDCGIAGLAKRDEEIWLPARSEKNSKPIKLSKDSEALKLLQAVRDETHRFATKLNQRLRSKDLTLRSLESIAGIGAKRALLILQKFENLQNITHADIQDIADAGGINLNLAKIVKTVINLELENRLNI